MFSFNFVITERKYMNISPICTVFQVFTDFICFKIIVYFERALNGLILLVSK